ncbi:PAS domain S-box protein [Azospirillum sp. ST 5-10]|uniref:sensor histidine kinase n=1 Tax=unclassified Azospirillum TaxID=2630922 RepID=UPI003F49C9DF
MDSATSPQDRMRIGLHRQRVLARFGARALAEPSLPILLQEAAAGTVEGIGIGHARVIRHRSDGGDPLVVADAGGRDDAPGAAAESDAAPLAAPIVAAGAAWGVLEVDAGEERPFHDEDLHFVQSVALLLSAAVARAEAQERRLLDRASLDAVLAQMPAGVAIAETPSGRLLLHNAKAIELIGHPMLESDSYHGYARYGALHPDGTPYRPDEYPIARAALFDETVELEPMTYRRGDGRITQFLVSAAPVRNAAGAPVLAVSTFHDISERRRLEAEQQRTRQALAETEARYRAAFEQAAVGLAEADADGRFRAVNNRLCALLGYRRDELLERRFQELTHPDDLAADLALTRRLYAGELATFSLEKRFIRKDGSVLWSSLSCARVEADGRPPYTLAVVQDVGERKRAEAEREELLVQKDLLMREMNHRIKNSLQIVASLVLLQAADLDDPEAVRRFQETAARIATVAQVHERLYRTGVDAREATVDVAAYLHDLGRDLARTLGLPPAGLNVRAAAVTLPADVVVPLGLIVNELVTNAAKYAYPAAPSGPIGVALEEVGGRLRLAVEDEGVGLPDGFSIAGSKGLGMRVLLALTQQLGAELALPAKARGVRFELTLPDHSSERI